MSNEIKEQELKSDKNPHLKGVTRLKVQALRDGFFGGSTVIKGEVFIIKEKIGLHRISKFADYTEKVIITVAQQFSKHWMVELERGNTDDGVDVLNNAELKEKRAEADLLRARSSEASEATLPQQPVVRQALPESAPAKLSPAQKAAATRAANKAKKEAEETIVVSDGEGADVI